MCKAVANVINKLPSSKLREKISVNDPVARKMGYAAMADPLGDFMHKRAGTKSEGMKRAARMGARNANAHRDAAYKRELYENPSAHVSTIASRRG